MLLPLILARIEQKHLSACFGIDRFKVVALENVAAAATQAQVGIDICASFS